MGEGGRASCGVVGVCEWGVEWDGEEDNTVVRVGTMNSREMEKKRKKNWRCGDGERGRKEENGRV